MHADSTLVQISICTCTYSGRYAAFCDTALYRSKTHGLSPVADLIHVSQRNQGAQGTVHI